MPSAPPIAPMPPPLGVAGLTACVRRLPDAAGGRALITGMLDNPKRPFVAILGGSKVSDKIKVIDALLDKLADVLIIGGGMCFTFLLAQGYSVGTSLKEEDWVERAAQMMQKAKDKGVKLLLPVDVRGGGQALPRTPTSPRRDGRRHPR